MPSCLSCSLPEQFSQIVVLVMAAHHYQFSQHCRYSCLLVSLHSQLESSFKEVSNIKKVRVRVGQVVPSVVV